MRKLRLIKPWRLQTRHQKTGYDRLDMVTTLAPLTPCCGPRGNVMDEAFQNPRTVRCSLTAAGANARSNAGKLRSTIGPRG